MKFQSLGRAGQIIYKLHRLKSRVFKRPPALFLHIQKTAGSAIVYVLREFYQKSCINYGDFAGKDPEQLSHMTFISGHFGYDYVKDLMPARYTFTFLRHPGERILLLFYFFLTRNPDQFPIYRFAQEHTLEAFLEAGLKAGPLKEYIWNHQAWQLAHGWASLTNKTLEDFSPDQILDLARSHLKMFSYVGLTETLEADCKNILKALKIYYPEKMAIVNATGPRLSVQDLSPAATELLEELTCLDRKLYDEVVVRRGQLHDLRNPKAPG